MTEQPFHGRRQFQTLFSFAMAGLLLGSPLSVVADTNSPLDTQRVDAGLTAYEGDAELSGNFVIAGSDTMQPLLTKLSMEFRRRHPHAKVAVQGGGSELAMTQFLTNQAAIRRGDAKPLGHLVSGHVELLASSRPLNEEELAHFQSRYGHPPIGIPIALDAIAIYVHKNNPIKGLTLEQVEAIFAKEPRTTSGPISNWGQLGLEGQASQAIHRFGRDKRSGTRAMFKQLALHDGELRDDVAEAPGSASEILDIGKDPWAIGYAGIGFQASIVRTVPIAERANAAYVLPSVETAGDKTYPLARPLYLYAKDDTSKMKPIVREFLRWINTREGQQAVVRAGVYAISAETVTKNLQALGIKAVGRAPSVALTR